jgi:hypothetical protein
MPYCENCGSEINSTAKFCRNCGAAQSNAPLPSSASVPPNASPQPIQPVAPAPLAPQATPSQAPVLTVSDESVLGVLVLSKPKSLGRCDSFTGVVTNQRMIFAQVTSDMLKQAAQMAKDQAKAEGKGFFGQWSDQMKVSFIFAQRYFSIAPSAILTETPGNFAVDNNVTSEVKIKHKDMMRGGQVYEYKFEMEIHSSQGKYEFLMDQRDDYIKLLKQVYGDRVKMPFGYFSHGVKINL